MIGKNGLDPGAGIKRGERDLVLEIGGEAEAEIGKRGLPGLLEDPREGSPPCIGMSPLLDSSTSLLCSIRVCRLLDRFQPL